MKIKNNYILTSFVGLSLLLTGCAGNTTEINAEVTSENTMKVENKEYDLAIEKGLNELENENYEKAEAYFEIALEENFDDERARVLIEQVRQYKEATSLFEQEAYEESSEKAEAVQSMENGSEVLVGKADQLLTDIQSIAAEKKAQEEKVKAEEEMIEKFNGIFVLFSGTPYESRVEYMFIMNNNTVMQGFSQSGYTISEVTEKRVDADSLIINVYTPEQAGYSESTSQYTLQAGYDENDYKYITFEDDTVLYPITVDDLIENGFNVSADSESVINKLRAYDTKVPRAVSRTNTELLDGYSAKQIEYARVWLNTMDYPEVSELNVYYEKAGTPINAYDEESAVYPEDVTIITGNYTADGMIVYSGNGDGTINVYSVPSHWQSTPDEWPSIYEDILDTEEVYLEPLKDEQVVQLVQRMTIHE